MLIGAHDADADAATRSRHALALEAGALAAVLCAMRELAHVDVMTQRGLMALGVIVGRRRSTLKVPPLPPPFLGSAPARPLRLLRARLAAPGSSALPEGGRPTGRPATASAARASRL